MENGAALSLTQEGQYPYDDRVTFTVTSSRPTELALHFRIPAWAEGASLFVNGTLQKGMAKPGEFAAIRREWKSGDRVELELPLKMRLETIDARHTDTVALLRGPLVLMAAKPRQDAPVPQIDARTNSRGEAHQPIGVAGHFPTGAVTMLPFTSLGELPYTTYVKVS